MNKGIGDILSVGKCDSMWPDEYESLAELLGAIDLSKLVDSDCFLGVKK